MSKWRFVLAFLSAMACVALRSVPVCADDISGQATEATSPLSSPVRLSLHDHQGSDHLTEGADGKSVRFSMDDSFISECVQTDYPDCVSHDPGKPKKPRQEKPGDISVRDCPSERYGIANSERAGEPQQVAWWARCSVSNKYSAAYVGGGTPWILPHQTRSRASHEGTWGMDYNGLFKPRRVWLSWSCDRAQGGLGAYETDREGFGVEP